MSDLRLRTSLFWRVFAGAFVAVSALLVLVLLFGVFSSYGAGSRGVSLFTACGFALFGTVIYLKAFQVVRVVDGQLVYGSFLRRTHLECSDIKAFVTQDYNGPFHQNQVAPVLERVDGKRIRLMALAEYSSPRGRRNVDRAVNLLNEACKGGRTATTPRPG